MKVAAVAVRNFKRFDQFELRVRNALTEEIADRFLLLGDNGTGKTTVLQAIALCLSRACHITPGIEDFDWIGWVPGRYARSGTPVVELEVHFSQDEIEATQEAARRWDQMRPGAENREFVEPASSKVVHLKLEGNRISARGGRSELYQFQGRRYARNLLNVDPKARDLFDRVPGIFWFDQLRNLASPPPDPPTGNEHSSTHGDGDVGSSSRLPFHRGVASLRSSLNTWQLAKQSGKKYKRDYLTELESLYSNIFSGRRFGPPEPMYRGGIPSPSDNYFILQEGERTYDIEEMSGGEQAVFPILYELVRLQIRHSVVIIDEVDLNLHPPLAQAFVSALPQIGPGCQFFLTTHSESVTAILSPEQVHRLPGGRLCL